MSCAALVLAAITALATQDPTGATNSNSSAEPKRDLVAARFLTTCAGCHSLTGAKLSGPELSAAATWPDDQLKTAIKKMESKVGPLSDEVVVELAEFLKTPEVRDRLKTEGERIAAQFMAKMEPANPALGRELFFGTTAFKNAGLPCSACHTAQGRGGNLGPNLSGIHAKAGGEMPLISAIEQSKFKIMEPHYARHPVTKQEAMHLAKYLSTLDPNDTRIAGANFATVGAGCAAAALVGIVLVMKNQRNTRRRDVRLQRRRK